MALTDYGGGPYRELDGSMAGGFGTNAGGFTRKFWVGWADQFAFVKALLGYPVIQGPGTFPPTPASMTRVLPDPYPPAPWFFCRNVDIAPQGCITKDLFNASIYVQGVFIDAHYEPIDFPLTGPSAYMTETVDGVVQFMSVDNTQLVWDSDDRPLQDPPGLPFRGVEYTMCFHEVPDGAINWGTLFNNQNTLNDNPVQIGIWSQIPTGSMLFLKFEAHRVHPPDGSKAWEITLHHHIRNQDHNTALRASTGQWEWFRWKGGTKGTPGTPNRPPKPPTGTLLKYIDMTQLWKFPMP